MCYYIPTVFTRIINLLAISNSKCGIKSYRPADRWEKPPPVWFSSFDSVSLFFLGPLVQGVSHPQEYQAVSLSILQKRKKTHQSKLLQLCCNFKLLKLKKLTAQGTVHYNADVWIHCWCTNPHLFQQDSLTQSQRNPFCRGIVWPCLDLGLDGSSGGP